MKIALGANVFWKHQTVSKQSGKILGAIMKGQEEGIVSTVTIAEVLTGFYLTGEAARATNAKMLLKDWKINGFKIIPVTFEIADLAANLRAKRGGRLLGALIVATAINQEASIVYSQDKVLKRFSRDIKTSEL